MDEIERLARLEVTVEQHGKSLDTMSAAVTSLSLSVNSLVTNYSHREKTNMIAGGFICAIIGALPSLIQAINK